mmetsp:Transcript_31975/g.56749  ORF Transcript_31975/g.56749 Transcript_31975/m.56749 type:complete len:107 (+) Transcript_31975:647-967(+)
MLATVRHYPLTLVGRALLQAALAAVAKGELHLRLMNCRVQHHHDNRVPQIHLHHQPAVHMARFMFHAVVSLTSAMLLRNQLSASPVMPEHMMVQTRVELTCVPPSA